MQSAQFSLNSRLEGSHWWFAARRRIIQGLIAHLIPPNPSACIVDAGCGTGGTIGDLSAIYRCIGVDPSSEAIELARRRYPSVRFICGNVCERLRDLAPEVDLVMLTDVLEHVADDRAMLADLVASVRPGTHFLITVPADRSLWSCHDRSYGHYRRYDRELLEQVWRGLPVAPVLTSYFNSRLYPLVKLVRTLNQWRGKASGEAGTDLQMPVGPVNWILERVFRGEGKGLVDLLAGKQDRPYRWGVSLIAILRRQESAGAAGRLAAA